MHIVEQIFWLFFAAVAAFIAWSAISMWFGRLRRESEVPSPSRRNATFGTGGSLDSTAAGFATVDITGSASESRSSDFTSGDSGGGESGGESGGGDFSGGGGEWGGGGSSGGW